MSIDILHVSDTHLGKTQYGSRIRAEDFARAFDTAVDIAIEKDVDAVIHTGDLFDDRSPNTGDISSALSSVKRLSDEEIPFLGIVGNHERKWDNQWLDIIGNIDTAHRLGTTPYVIDGAVAVYGFDSIRDAQWDTIDLTVDEPPEDCVTLVCMHELFEELVPPMKADRSAEEVLDRLNITPDAMPLGDYHGSVEGRVNDVPLFYAGATERTSTTQSEPTVRLISIGDDDISYPWRKINGVRDDVPRPFHTVEIDLEDDTTESHIRTRVEEDVSRPAHSVVVVNLHGSKDAPVSSSDVYNILSSMNVLVPYVSDKRSPEVVEFDSEDVADPTSIDMDELIEDAMEERSISDTVQEIESDIVRDLTVNKSNIRDIVSERVEINGDSYED